MVTKNIHHSKLSSLDSIQCQGSIIGGVTEALNYVEVLSVGSELAGLTRVKIGFHYELESLLTLKKTFYGQIEQIQKRYFEAIENGKLESRLRPSLEADINLVKKNGFNFSYP